MYIEDSIAYAGEKAPMLKVTVVRPMEGYKLWLQFNDGTTKVFDFTSLLEKPAFAPLKKAETFNSVYIDYGVPVWNDGDIDISPEYLYEN